MCMCLGFAACSAKVQEDETSTTATKAQATALSSTTQTTVESTTADETTQTTQTTQSTTEKKTTTTKKTTTKQKSSDNDTSISLNEALNVLSDFYGTAYDVNATVVEDGYQYFAIYDKKGTKYASVKVNLSTSDAIETIIATGETYEFNLSE